MSDTPPNAYVNPTVNFPSLFSSGGKEPQQPQQQQQQQQPQQQQKSTPNTSSSSGYVAALSPTIPPLNSYVTTPFAPMDITVQSTTNTKATTQTTTTPPTTQSPNPQSSSGYTTSFNAYTMSAGGGYMTNSLESISIEDTLTGDETIDVPLQLDENEERQVLPFQQKMEQLKWELVQQDNALTTFLPPIKGKLEELQNGDRFSGTKQLEFLDFQAKEAVIQGAFLTTREQYVESRRQYRLALLSCRYSKEELQSSLPSIQEQQHQQQQMIAKTKSTKQKVTATSTTAGSTSEAVTAVKEARKKVLEATTALSNSDRFSYAAVTPSYKISFDDDDTKSSSNNNSNSSSNAYTSAISGSGLGGDGYTVPGNFGNYTANMFDPLQDDIDPLRGEPLRVSDPLRGGDMLRGSDPAPPKGSGIPPKSDADPLRGSDPLRGGDALRGSDPNPPAGNPLRGTAGIPPKEDADPLRGSDPLRAPNSPSKSKKVGGDALRSGDDDDPLRGGSDEDPLRSAGDLGSYSATPVTPIDLNIKNNNNNNISNINNNSNKGGLREDPLRASDSYRPTYAPPIDFGTPLDGTKYDSQFYPIDDVLRDSGNNNNNTNNTNNNNSNLGNYGNSSNNYSSYKAAPIENNYSGTPTYIPGGLLTASVDDRMNNNSNLYNINNNYSSSTNTSNAYSTTDFGSPLGLDNDSFGYSATGNNNRMVRGNADSSGEGDDNENDNEDSFNDDDSLVRLGLVCEHPTLSSEYAHQLKVLIKVAAPTSIDARAPIDIVLVVDKSRSMRSKLGLMKQTLSFVVSKLDSRDNLAIITFSGSITIALPLVRMDSAGKERAFRAINSIALSAGTLISDGLLMAAHVLRTSQRNPLGAILLFTDGNAHAGCKEKDEFTRDLTNHNWLAYRTNKSILGQDPGFRQEGDPFRSASMYNSYGYTATTNSSNNSSNNNNNNKSSGLYFNNIEESNNNMFDSKGSHSFSCWTFGFGLSHNTGLLTHIASIGHGMYYYIKDDKQIPIAFASCIGGLLSTVARDVNLEIRTTRYSDFVKLLVPIGYRVDQVNDVITIGIGDLSSEQERNLIYTVNARVVDEKDLSFMADWPILQVKMTYIDVLTNNLITVEETATIQRKFRYPKPPANRDISIHTNRIKTAIACRKANHLTSKQNINGAIDCVKKTRDEIVSSASAGEEICKDLVKQLTDLLTALNNTKGSKGFDKQATSYYASNAYQTATTFGFENLVENHNNPSSGSGYIINLNSAPISSSGSSSTEAPKPTSSSGYRSGYTTSFQNLTVIDYFNSSPNPQFNTTDDMEGDAADDEDDF